MHYFSIQPLAQESHNSINLEECQVSLRRFIIEQKILLWLISKRVNLLHQNIVRKRKWIPFIHLAFLWLCDSLSRLQKLYPQLIWRFFGRERYRTFIQSQKLPFVFVFSYINSNEVIVEFPTLYQHKPCLAQKKKIKNFNHLKKK